MEKYYKIAGLVVAMDSFGRTELQAEPYSIEATETVDIRIVSEWDKKKSRHPGLSDDIGEYCETGFVFYKHLLMFDGMMLHSSAVVVDGKAYLFSADPGTGKSTHTKLWLDMLGDRSYILNDDKPALRLIDGTWYAFGTPWSGKHDISVNTGVPVAGIAMLERSQENSIEPFFGISAIRNLLKQVNLPRGMEYREKVLELLDKLITQIPVWKLECNMEPEAAKVSFEAMSGEKWEDEKQ